MADPPGPAGEPALALVPVTAADVDALLDGRLPARMRGYRFGPGWPHADSAAGLAFVAVGGLGWLVVDDGAIVGECGTKGPPDPAGVVEIGYGLAGPSRGRGLGTRVVRAVVAALRDVPDVRTVTAEVEASNVASRKVLERSGFTVTAADDTLVRYRRLDDGVRRGR